MYVISENYDFILDIVIDSKSRKIYNHDWPFYCEIACKQDAERKNIEIFNIFEDHFQNVHDPFEDINRAFEDMFNDPFFVNVNREQHNNPTLF